MYRHTPDMGEISGFGGGYEECCQDMLEAGIKWLIEHEVPLLDASPTDLQGRTISNVYGVFDPVDDDARALSQVIVDASKGEATGAMHQAVMERLFWIAAHDWEQYCQHLRAAKRHRTE